MSLDPDKVNVPEGAWELFEVTETMVRYRAPLERYPDGRVAYIVRSVPREIDTLLDDNRRAFDASAHQRFGDGKIIGRIPLNVLYDPRTQIAEKMREGDKDHFKWWLNSDDARPFRRFRGKV